MRDALPHRTLIIGNSGSGKSTLAAALGARAGCVVLSLDTLYWQDQRLLLKRPAAKATRMAVTASETPCWVIEGVFGWLIDVVTPRATELIWLDLPWVECRDGLERRAAAAPEDRAETDDLLIWAQDYWTRATPSSYAGHLRIFDSFAAPKRALRSRAEIAAFVGPEP